MTVIVGLAQDGHVYIGGDSAGILGYDVTALTSGKVWRSGDMLFGAAGNFRMLQLLRYSLEPPHRKPEVDVVEYLTTSFADAVLDCLSNGRYPRKAEDDPGGVLIIGYEGRLFCMQQDISFIEPVSGAYAVGAGGDNYAMGVLYATQGQEPRERVQLALEAAEEFSADVRRPFVIEKL